MSLPLRLTLAFMALVSLVIIVGITSFTTTRQLGTAVSALRSRVEVDLRHVDLSTASLEIEGSWHRQGYFLARNFEVHPGARRPKLRGAIQAIGDSPRSVTLYGVAVVVNDDTEFDKRGDAARLEELSVGDRAEVVCYVDGDTWVARNIRAGTVKSSDKIKGTPTAVHLDGEPPETIEISGLVIAVEPAGDDVPESALGRTETATQMALALQQTLAGAYALVDAARAPPGGGDRELGGDASEQLESARERFEYQLGRAQKADAGGMAARWLRPLADQQQALRSKVNTLEELALSSTKHARAYLEEELNPFLETELLPLVYGYQSHTQERLGEQLRWIVVRSATTTRVALATSIVAIVVAVVLGFLVWRSISGPIQVLHSAAVRIGEGQLDTRVDLDSKDEIGVLAAAFNRMAQELGATTVSVDNLEGIFDSMAGALVIFSPDGRITNVNRAAVEMLGYENKDELLGAAYDQICEVPDGERARLPVDAVEGGVLASTERVFVRRNGDRLPVSFSGTQLRRHGGPLRGYVCVAQDLSGLKRIESRLRASLAEKELLLREVHHRVKNNLQIICSMLAMQAGDLEDVRTREQFEQSESRIRSMALIHEQLYDSEDFSEIDMQVYIQSLTANLSRSLSRNAPVSIEVAVEGLTIDMDQSLACGLIVSELVMRSFKYAFCNDRAGVITIRLFAKGERDCVLEIEDDGTPVADASADNEEALGMSLVTALVQQLRGTMTVRREGHNLVRVVFPSRGPDVMVA